MKLEPPPSPPHPLCQRCSSLDVLAWLREEPPIERDRDLPNMMGDERLFRDLGQVKSVVLRKDCALCCCIFGIIPNPEDLTQNVILVLSWTMYRLEASISMDTKEKCASSKYLSAFVQPSSTPLTVEDLVSTRGDGLCATGAELEGSSRSLKAKVVNPAEIDYESISRWLSTCANLHPQTCTPQVSKDLSTILLIDVFSRSLVTYPAETVEYITLSYVWGELTQLVPGAGKPGTKLGLLCQTVEDALTFTKKRGKQYLWVDSVCIDQENESQKEYQIGIMGAIYQGAYATIVAFSGHSADAGLPRVGPTKTSYRQLRCNIGGVSLVSLCPTLSQLVWVMPWGRRAWTYQEALLSQRCIYISKFQVQFECNAMTYYESIDESKSWVHQALHDEEYFRKENRFQQVNTGVLRSPLAANRNLKNNALELYSICARLYSDRRLTRQSDALNAFSGILQALQRSSTYASGIFWALPHADLNWALLWDGWYRTRRREGFPSWSWLSRPGGIWPGEPLPEGPYDPHEYPFDLQIWKKDLHEAKLIFATSYRKMRPSVQREFHNDPIAKYFDSFKGDFPGDLMKDDDPFSDRVLCIEIFELQFMTKAWVRNYYSTQQHYAFYSMIVRGINIMLRVPESADLMNASYKNIKRRFLLMARYYSKEEDGIEWVAHHLLLVEPCDKYLMRTCAVKMDVPLDGLYILKALGLRRSTILLI